MKIKLVTMVFSLIMSEKEKEKSSEMKLRGNKLLDQNHLLDHKNLTGEKSL